jgi:hypothetical protein
MGINTENSKEKVMKKKSSPLLSDVILFVIIIFCALGSSACLAAITAASMVESTIFAANSAASIIGGIEKTSINAAVAPGVTKEKLASIHKVAFVFEGIDPNDGLTRIMSDNLAIELMKLGFECLEKSQFNNAAAEQNMQVNGVQRIINAIKAGQLSGIQGIISGGFIPSGSMTTGPGNFSSTFLIQSGTIKILSVETGENLMVVSINYKYGQKPDDAAKSIAKIIKWKMNDPFENDKK